MSDARSTIARFARLQLPVIVLAALPLVLAWRFGGYHPRHAGWAVLALVAWACVQAARGRLSASRSLAGVATMAMLALVVWTTASIAWVDATVHEAWVEAMRAAGYAAMFVLGGSLLASARSFTRYAALTAGGIALVGVVVLGRIAFADAPLRAFVAGRLDWPIGYAPGLSGMALFGMLLLLGIACAADLRFDATRSREALVSGGAALAGAGVCTGVALLAQSRGTLPALAIGIAISLIASPNRLGWMLRIALLLLAALVVRHQLAAPFQTQFDLRQAPFTEGSNEDALLAAAVDAARTAARSVLAMSAVLGALGVALVPLVGRTRHAVARLEQRRDIRLVVPVTVTIVAIIATLLVVSAGNDRSPLSWASDQWRGCIDPPERVNDPGSGSSYFANTGTGRCDYYRVALLAGREHPLLGLGAGNFRGFYVLHRETAEEPRVVHSLPLQLLAELGIIGALLGTTVLACVGWAAVRFVRSGPRRDATFAGVIGALGYWVAHASIDWLWQLPAVSLSALGFAGGLVACVSPAQRRLPARVGAPIAAGVLLAAIALVLPVTMADRALREARDPKLRERDPAAALTAARDAQSFSPSWAEPAITEGVLLAAAGRREQAAVAARRAVSLEPRSWFVQYQASGLIGLADTAGGRAAFLAARRLNPQLPADVKQDAAAKVAEADAQQ